MKRIAFLGPKGTVSEEAARYFFADSSFELIPYKVISDLFMATVTGETDFSVIPIENTIDSSVTLHLDWLVHEVDLPIQSEWIYPSIQNLIGNRKELQQAGNGTDEGSFFTGIKKIVSIPIAIAQCRKYLNEHLPHVEFEHVTSTAEGVKYVKEHPNEGFAAIGTSLGAEFYGLDLLAKRITDHQNNYTRFILVGKEPIAMHKPVQPLTKTTILITLPEDYPGALHQVLSAFAWRKINLSKIESRPTKKKLGNYYFYIDIEQSLDSVLLPAALSEIEAIGCQVRILGSYPSYAFETENSEV